MKRGIRQAKTPKQVTTGSTKGLGKAVAQIVGIGLVAGTALVLGTDKVMKKIFKPEEAAEEDVQEEIVEEEIIEEEGTEEEI